MAELNNEEVDHALTMPVHQLLTSIVTGARRTPRQAVQDLRRVLNRYEDQIDREEADAQVAAVDPD